MDKNLKFSFTIENGVAGLEFSGGNTNDLWIIVSEIIRSLYFAQKKQSTLCAEAFRMKLLRLMIDPRSPTFRVEPEEGIAVVMMTPGGERGGRDGAADN